MTARLYRRLATSRWRVAYRPIAGSDRRSAASAALSKMGCVPSMPEKGGSEQVSPPGCMTPGLVPILARGIDNAAVGLEELVGDLEDCEHQPALGTPCDMTAALLAPDEFAGLGLDALRRAFLVDEAALKNVGLLDVDMLVVGQHRARREPHQRGHQAGRAIEQQRLGFAAGEAGLLPLHALRTNDMRMRVGGLRTLRRHGVHGNAPLQ